MRKSNQSLLDLRLIKIDYITDECWKLKYFYIILFWNLINVIRFAVYLIFNRNENHWIYFLDITRHLKGLSTVQKSKLGISLNFKYNYDTLILNVLYARYDHPFS
jgi:hypothetical protein